MTRAFLDDRAYPSLKFKFKFPLFQYLRGRALRAPDQSPWRARAVPTIGPTSPLNPVMGQGPVPEVAPNVPAATPVMREPVGASDTDPESPRAIGIVGASRNCHQQAIYQSYTITKP